MNVNVADTALPVGLTICSNGNLFSGLYNGSGVIEICPKAKAIVRTIELPTPLVTAPCFGGDNLDTLFVTTANLPLNFFTTESGTPIREPPAGNLFMIHGVGKGTPSFQPHFQTC